MQQSAGAVYSPGQDRGVKQLALYAALFLMELLVFGVDSACDVPDPMSIAFSTHISSSGRFTVHL